MSKLTKCEACTRVVADAHFALRRRVTPPHALSSIEATDALESLCSDSYRRYDDAPNLMEKVCDDMMDEHVMQLLKVGTTAPHPASSPPPPTPHPPPPPSLTFFSRPRNRPTSPPPTRHAQATPAPALPPPLWTLAAGVGGLRGAGMRMCKGSLRCTL